MAYIEIGTSVVCSYTGVPTPILQISDFGWPKYIESIYNFLKVKLCLAVGGAVNPLNRVWGKASGYLLRISPADDLKLRELPAQKSNVGKFSSNKFVHLLL